MEQMLTELFRAALSALNDAVHRDAELRGALRDITRTLQDHLSRLEEQPLPLRSSEPEVGDEHSPSPAGPVAVMPVARHEATADEAREMERAVHEPVALEPVRLKLGDASAIVVARAEWSGEPGPPASGRTSLLSAASLAPAVVSMPQSARPLSSPSAESSPALDIAEVARRMRLKAEACRWAIDQRRRQQDHFPQHADADEPDPQYLDLIEQARQVQPCYLWALGAHYTLPDDPTMEALAGSYEAASSALDLMRLATEDSGSGDAVEDAMRLLAEAQSAVRAGCVRVDRSLEDADQRAVFYWLKHQTSARQIYVEHHMRLDDPADPDDWLGLQDRIADQRGKLEQAQGREHQRRRLFGKARYHAKRAQTSAEIEDWSKTLDAIESLLSVGVPPSDREVRELLLPLIDEIPEVELGPGVLRVLEEIDRYVEQVSAQPAEPARRGPTQTLLGARALLRGRGAVLIGGYPRELTRRRIERAFELSELRWLHLAHHQSLEPDVLPLMRRDEFSIFITMTRFRSHAFGPQVREWCKEHGKVYIELPGGYGVEQIAHQVLQQRSYTLENGGSPERAASANLPPA